MTPEEFATEVKKEFRNEFKSAFITANVGTGLGRFICITFGIQSKDKWANGYFENDPASHKIMLHLNDDATFKTGEGLELLMGGVVHVTPAPDSYLAWDSVKVGWRNKKGTPEKMLLHLKKYFAKLKTVAKENQEKIPKELDLS